jgi:hypothetical protein
MNIWEACHRGTRCCGTWSFSVSHEALNGLDFTSTKYVLHHAVNFDGDLSFENTSIETQKLSNVEQVLKLDGCSANSLISDANGCYLTLYLPIKILPITP